jgi:hypothetical protein
MSKQKKSELYRKRKKNELYRKRYAVLRAIGYSPQEASKLRYRNIDISSYRFSRKTGKLIQGPKTRARLKETSKKIELFPIDKKTRDLETIVRKTRILNDKMMKSPSRYKTTYSAWGYIVHSDKHKDSTMKKIHAYARSKGISEKHAYFIAYLAYEYNISIEEAYEMSKAPQYEKYR